jgi:hypothetical protein
MSGPRRRFPAPVPTLALPTSSMLSRSRSTTQSNAASCEGEAAGLAWACCRTDEATECASWLLHEAQTCLCADEPLHSSGRSRAPTSSSDRQPTLGDSCHAVCVSLGGVVYTGRLCLRRLTWEVSGLAGLRRLLRNASRRIYSIVHQRYLRIPPQEVPSCV